jgi:hypothetical protein
MRVRRAEDGVFLDQIRDLERRIAGRRGRRHTDPADGKSSGAMGIGLSSPQPRSENLDE